jgi:phospholipid/cholesterol/gamma-HCH transport system substrate-binding protein
MSRQARVGILVFAGLALFLVALFAIASRSFLFSTTFPLESEFENVAGLAPGAPVQYQGASAGRVENVVVPDRVGGTFTVQMAIKDDFQPLVNKGTIAQIQSQSLVGGGMMVVLTNPSQKELTDAGTARGEFEPIEPGGRIQGEEPFNIGQTSDRLLGTVDTFATVAVEMKRIMRDVQSGRGSLGRFLYDDALYDRSVATIEQAEATAAETQQLMTNLSASAERITGSLETATAGFQQVLGKVNRGEGTLGLLLNDESAYNRFLAAADTLVQSTQRIESVLANTENATQWASLGAYRFAENMEALKHNFLFKSYFEERGYMEKADFEIRESAIEATYEDLQAWQRELNERQARLEEVEARLQALEADPSATSEAPATEEAPSAGEASEPRPAEAEAPSETDSPSPDASSEDPPGGSSPGTGGDLVPQAPVAPHAIAPQPVGGALPDRLLSPPPARGPDQPDP